MRHPSYYQAQQAQREHEQTLAAAANANANANVVQEQVPDVLVQAPPDPPMGYLTRYCPAVVGNVQLRIADNVVIKMPANMLWAHVIEIEPTRESYEAKVTTVRELPELNVVDARPNPGLIARATCCQRFLDCFGNIGSLGRKCTAGLYLASICHQSFMLVVAAACLLTHLATVVVSSVHRDHNWYIVLIYNLGFVMTMALMALAYFRIRGDFMVNITPVVFMAWICKIMQVLQVTALIFPPELGNYSAVVYHTLLIFDILTLEILTMHGTTLLSRY